MGKRTAETDLEPLHVGNDEDRSDVSVVIGQDGRAAFVPASVGRLSDHQLDVWTAVQRLVLEIRDRQGELDELVAEARDLGIPWSALGWGVGLTAEGARKRWGEGR